MNHSIYRIVNFDIVGPYTLLIMFDDGTEQRIDFRPVIRRGHVRPIAR